MKSKVKIVFAGGGTGGHLFPALAVAEAIKKKLTHYEFLFVGTKNRMESEIIPRLGYKYFGTSIIGLPRTFSLSIVKFLMNLAISVIQAFICLVKFKPQVCVGTGSYISFPPLIVTKLLRKPIVLIEANSYPGIATKTLAPFAKEIYLAFEETKKYFKNKKNLVVIGPPVRKNLLSFNKDGASKFFGLNPNRKTILVLGGSLGAKSINEMIKEIYLKINSEIQIIWQTGKNDFENYKNYSIEGRVVVIPFLERMDYAYSLCDLLISRAGASTISEILANGIPAILIPSPNVTENHQYFNAMTLVNNEAAVIHLDNEPAENLLLKIQDLISDDEKRKMLGKNARKMFKENSTELIAERIIQLIEK